MTRTQSLLVLLSVMSTGSCQQTCVDNIPTVCNTTTFRFTSNNVTDPDSPSSPLCNFWTVGPGSANTRTMTSNLICYEEGQQLCLSFKFNFRSASIQKLIVYLSNVTKWIPPTIWSFTSNTSFTNLIYASVPIQTNRNFSIKFESRTTTNGHVNVKNVKIEQNNCTVLPPECEVKVKKSSPITNQSRKSAPTTNTVVTSGRIYPKPDHKGSSTTSTVVRTGLNDSKHDDKEHLSLVTIIAPVATVILICVILSLLLLVIYKRGKLTCYSKTSQDTKSCQESAQVGKPVSPIPPGIICKDNAVCNDGGWSKSGSTCMLSESEACYSSVNDHTSSTFLDEAVDIGYHNVNNNPTSQKHTTHDIYSVIDKSNQGFENQTPPDVYSQVRKPGSLQGNSTSDYANSSIKKTLKQPTQKSTSQDVYAVVKKPTHSAGKSPAEEHPVSQDVYACVNKAIAVGGGVNDQEAE